MALIYGFQDLADIAQVRAIEVDPQQLQSAVVTSVAQHDGLINEVLNMFTEQTEVNQLKFNGGQDETENQPLDEWGRSRKIKRTKVDYTTGFPIFSSGQARGANFITSMKMTVQQYNDILATAFNGDVQWIKNRLFASLFINTERVIDDPNTEEGEITVRPLANGDGIPYSTVEGGLATDNHYLGFNNPIDDANNPFPTLYTEITEHPYNTGEVVTFVASDLYSTDTTHGVDKLTSFVEIPIDPLIIEPAGTTTRLARTTIPGLTLPSRAVIRGRVNNQWIVEWPSLPSGYGFTMTTGGPKPLKRRVDPEPELRGFKPIATRDDFPYFEEQWIRRMGFGGWNRVAMVVFFVGGAYAVPTKYTNMRW